MKPGDSVILKEEYNVSMSFGNIGLFIAGGAEAIVVKTQNLPEISTNTVMVGFKLTNFITATVMIEKEALKEIT